METQKQTQPELQLEAPRTPKRFKLPELSRRAKNIIVAIGLALITLPFAFIGVVSAYDSFILNNLENAYKDASNAQYETQKAACATRKALAAYKADGLKAGAEKDRLMEVTKTECDF